MQKVVYDPAAISRLQELLEVLYIQDYVGFWDTAENYVRDIFSFAGRLPVHKRKATKISRFGHFFCSYKRNSHTTWFICFDVDDKEEIYLVRTIFNNHSEEYPRIIPF